MVRLGCTCLYPLRHLAGPQTVFQWQCRAPRLGRVLLLQYRYSPPCSVLADSSSRTSVVVWVGSEPRFPSPARLSAQCHVGRWDFKDEIGLWEHRLIGWICDGPVTERTLRRWWKRWEAGPGYGKPVVGGALKGVSCLGPLSFCVTVPRLPWNEFLSFPLLSPHDIPALPWA